MTDYMGSMRFWREYLILWLANSIDWWRDRDLYGDEPLVWDTDAHAFK